MPPMPPGPNAAEILQGLFEDKLEPADLTRRSGELTKLSGQLENAAADGKLGAWNLGLIGDAEAAIAAEEAKRAAELVGVLVEVKPLWQMVLTVNRIKYVAGQHYSAKRGWGWLSVDTGGRTRLSLVERPVAPSTYECLSHALNAAPISWRQL